MNVLRLKLFSMNTIVLSSEAAIPNVVGKKSAVYSDKVSPATTTRYRKLTDRTPFGTVAQHAYGATVSYHTYSVVSSIGSYLSLRMELTDWALSLIPYGDKRRAYRKVSHEMFSMRAAEKFQDDHQHKHGYDFLWRLLNSPESFMDDAAL